MLRINGREIITPEQAISWLFAICVSDRMLLSVLNGALGGGVSWIFYLVEIVLLIFALPAFFGVLRGWDIVASVVWAALLMTNVLLLNREQDYYLSLLIKVFLLCFPLYFIGRVAAEYVDSLVKPMQWVVAFATLAYTLMLFQNGVDFGNSSYSQNMGYTLLPPACAAICFALKGKFAQIPFALLLLYGVVAAGARGPLVSIFLMFAMYVIGRLNWRSFKRVFWLMIIGLVSLTVWINIDKILSDLIILFESNGVSVRVLKSLLQGTFTEGSGRNQLYELSLQGALDHLVGVGIFHDRQCLLEWTGDFVASSAGYYSHNLFMELLLQYGIIIGAILCVLFLVFTFKAFQNSRKNDNALLFLCVLFGTGLFPLMVSSSYVDWSPFYLMMGYMVSMAKNENESLVGEVG